MKHLAALLCSLVLASACGKPRAAGPSPTAPTAATPPVTPTTVATPPRTNIIVGDQVEIIDVGQLYSTINVTDCLTWPSPAHKSRGGESSWGSFYPKNGDVGTVLGLTQHCDAPEVKVAILDIGGNTLALGMSGLRMSSPGTAIAGGGIKTGNPFGGMGGGGGATVPTGGTSAGGVFAVGDTVTIVDDGQLYSMINSSDCLTWPSPDTKKRGGQDSWGSFYPVNGHVGTVLHTSAHCSGGGVVVAILDIGGNIVAMGETGLSRGGTPGAAIPQTFAVGETVKIIDSGLNYPSIHQNDCLAWPSAEIKAVAGSAGWGSYYPSNGDVGTVLGSSVHCDDPSVTVIFISVGKYYVPIGSAGLSR